MKNTTLKSLRCIIIGVCMLTGFTVSARQEVLPDERYDEEAFLMVNDVVNEELVMDSDDSFVPREIYGVGSQPPPKSTDPTVTVEDLEDGGTIDLHFD